MAALIDDTLKNNPLINPPHLPYDAPPLDVVKAEHFMPAVQYALASAKKEIEDIKNNDAPPTFKNTIEALEFSGSLQTQVYLIFKNIALTNSDDKIGAVKDEIEGAFSRHGSEIITDAPLFARIKAVYDVRANLTLTSEQRMLLEETYKGFSRNGANLDADDKKELLEINENLSRLNTAFDNNVVKSTEAYKKVIDNENDLAGVPDRVKNFYKKAAEDEGKPDKWIIRLSPPPTDILSHCENRALREEIYRATANVACQGEHDNSTIVLDIVRLRHKKAGLLGYPTYADYVLDDRMAKNPETVTSFLDRCASVYRPAAEDFLQQVRDFAKNPGSGTESLTDIKIWDVAFYSRKLKEKTFDLNLEELRPYFEFEKVIKGFHSHAEKLFNIKIAETSGKYPVYHPDVKVYEVNDNKTGEMLGLLYTDEYARPGAKSNGGWTSGFRKKGIENDENITPIAVIVDNYSKPTKTQPTLLSLADVSEIFHEGGHALNRLLAEGHYPSLTGSSVKWDFVEFCSQLQENYPRQKEVLDTFAVHYKTGQQLSPEIIKKINDMQNFGIAYEWLRVTSGAMLDMKWHTTDPASIKNVEYLEDGIVAKYSLFPREGGPLSNKFEHLFSDGGYASGYYGYQWAGVPDATAFEEIRKKGLYDPEMSDRLRKIYSSGGTVEPMELFTSAMGREPDPDALFRRQGLLPDVKKDKNAPVAPRPALS
ncbi:MAG: M3 family metallopeptidase [Pseudomonadota bacterium]